jgi:hypothetical protein
VSRTPAELEKMLWKSAEADAPPKDGAKRLTAALTSRLEALSSNAGPPAPTASAVPAGAGTAPFAAWKLVIAASAVLVPLAAAVVVFRSDMPSTSARPMEALESPASGLTASLTESPPPMAPPPSSVSVLSVDDLPSVRSTAVPSARRLAPAPPASAPARSAPQTAPGAAVTVAPPSARSSELDAEVAALDEVRAQLRAGAPSRAITLLAQYDTRFPHGLLRPEASVLQIEAFAASGDKARAHDLAVSFLARYPSDSHADRIRQLEAQLRP